MGEVNKSMAKKNAHILKFWPYRDSHSPSQQFNAKNTHTYLEIGDSMRGSQQVNAKKNAHILKFWPYRDSHSPSQQVNAKNTHTYIEILALSRLALAKSTSQRQKY